MEIKLNEEQQSAFENILEFIDTGNHKEEYCTLSGKAGCLAWGTKVIMYDKSEKEVQNIVVGDQLLGIDSTPRTVLSLCRGKQQMYKICHRNGLAYTVNEDHLLVLTKDLSLPYKIIKVKDYISEQKPLDWKEEWRGIRFENGEPVSEVETDIIKIVKQKEDFYYGFTLDGDHLFILANGIITHNTGKTVSLGQLVEYLPNRRFIVCAVSHKAKEVIADKIKSRNVRPMTIASLLSMKMDMETGKFTEDEWAQDIPIADADIVIIDEASMIDEKVISYMFKKKLYRTVLIFAGDIGQIRPIRETTSKLGDVSPVFKTPNISFLNTRVRQGEGNPILKHLDYYWDMTLNPNPEFDELQRENEENELGRIIYTNDMRNVINVYLPYFRQAITERNTNIIKVVTYRNTIREKINVMVRQALYGEYPNEYELGDLMIMTDTYQVDRFTKYENSLEFAVVDFKKMEKRIGDYTFKFFQVLGELENKGRISIPILAQEDKEKFNRYVTKLYNEAREKAGLARKNAFADARAVQSAFAKVDYGYSLSAHRSQGSTYDRVIVNITDMLKAPINIQEQASLIYTGGTRARKEVVMVSKSFKNTL